MVAARSISTVSVPPGGPSQTRMTRPQSSPRAPTGVNSHPDASSYDVRPGDEASRWINFPWNCEDPVVQRAGQVLDA